MAHCARPRKCRMAALRAAASMARDAMSAAADHAPSNARAARLGGRWHLALLGRVEARNGDLVVTRFNSQPTAALLARLALQPQRMHPREELAELLWPG